MVWIFRVLLIFSVLNLKNIREFDGGAGMEPVWIIMILGCLVMSITKFNTFFFSQKWFKIIFCLVAMLFLTVESLIIINGLKTNNDTKSDYIIVLGARVKGEVPSLALKKRLDKAYEYLNKNDQTVAVLSGGKGPGENITEAEAMRRYLVEKGIAQDRLILEPKSTNTYENMTYSFKLIDQNKKDAKVIVVTSSFHVLRSKMIAKDLGKKVDGIGASTLKYLVPNYYLREFFAVVKQFVI